MKQKSFLKLNLRWVLLFLAFTYSVISFSQITDPQFTSWVGVSTFSLSKDGTFIILEMKQGERSYLAFSNKTNNTWETPKPISELNDFLGGTASLGGPFVTVSGDRLYFHANYSNSKGANDIYYSDFREGKWSDPINLGAPINTSGDEQSPSLSGTNNLIYFSRDIISTKKQKKKKEHCRAIYYSTKNISEGWNEPQIVLHHVNKGCESCPNISDDGRTLYFSSIRNEDNKFSVYMSKKQDNGFWLLPQKISSPEKKFDAISPQFIGGNVTYISNINNRKQYIGSIYSKSVSDKFIPFKTALIKGEIKDLEGKPLDAKIFVKDPITSEIISVLNSDKKTGKYEICLLANKDYYVEIRKDGYSFDSFNEELKEEPTFHESKLFKSVKLNLSVFDAEIFRPIASKLEVKESGSEELLKVNSEEVAQGVYQLILPIGKTYKLGARKEGFETGDIEFIVDDDIVYNQFERFIALKPTKKEFEINVSNLETEESISANIVIKNLTRDETIVVTPEQMKSGKATVMLRDGDKYEFDIKGPKGYSFYNGKIDLKSETEKQNLDVELKPLKAKTSITLNNITFEKNSADLNEASFAELKRVVELIKYNMMKIEISAHTDDIGSEQYNVLLSERRAESVVKYLIENGVSEDMLTSKGYGESKPTVPNNSDENRALNRRVEFEIIGFVE